MASCRPESSATRCLFSLSTRPYAPKGYDVSVPASDPSLRRKIDSTYSLPDVLLFLQMTLCWYFGRVCGHLNYLAWLLLRRIKGQSNKLRLYWMSVSKMFGAFYGSAWISFNGKKDVPRSEFRDYIGKIVGRK